jgi:hypothetical protein
VLSITEDGWETALWLSADMATKEKRPFLLCCGIASGVDSTIFSNPDPTAKEMLLHEIA